MSVQPAQSASLPKAGFIIGGKKVTESSVGTYDHLYPADGTLTQSIPLGGAVEMDAAVKAARAALPGWRAMPVNQRRKVMLEFARVVRAHGDELNRIIMTENGTPAMMVDFFPEWIADLFDRYRPSLWLRRRAQLGLSVYERN